MAGERPLNVGDDFQMSADLYNDLVRSRTQRGGKPVVPAFPAIDRAVIRARNSTGADRMRFDAVSITSPVFTVDNAEQPGSEEYFAEFPVMDAVLPDWRDSATWGLILDAVKDGEVGRVLLPCATPVKLVGHRQVMVCGPDLSAGTAGALKTGAGACRVVWQDQGDDPEDEAEHWGLIQLGTSDDIEGTISQVATPDDGMVGPAVCQLKPWRYVDGQSQDVAARQMEQIDYEVMVINRDASLVPTEDAYGIARWINHEWRLIWVSC